MAQNRMHVRGYYARNRDQIICHKLRRACRLDGRVPRAHTIRAHDIPVEPLVDAFREWLGTAPDDKRRAQRIARFRRTLAQLQAG